MESETVWGEIMTRFGFNKISFCAANFKRLSLFTFSFSLLVFSFSLFTVSAFAQIDEPYEQPQPDDAAPPPLKMISKAERTALDALDADVSERTKLSLLLMESRLKQAEDLYARDSFDAMFGELGGLDALIDNTLNFLKKNAGGRGKILNNYKKLELSLRKFTPRIELIRRELPARYEYWVRSLIKNVRAARSKAIEPMFGDSVVPLAKEN